MAAAVKSLAGFAFAFVLAIAALAATAGRAADLQNGASVYRRTCSVCHGLTGLGAFPGIPNLDKRGGVLAQPDALLLDRIEHGYRSPGSQTAMPPKGGNPRLTHDDLVDVLAYMHREFGVQSASPEKRAAPDARSGSEAPEDHSRMGPGMMGRGMMGSGMNGGMMGR